MGLNREKKFIYNQYRNQEGRRTVVLPPWFIKRASHRIAAKSYFVTPLTGTSGLLHRFFEVLIYFLPVDDVKKCRYVFRPAILVFQIIGMLPDIQAQNRYVPLAQGAVLIGCGGDVKFTVVDDQPGPAAAE